MNSRSGKRRKVRPGDEQKSRAANTTGSSPTDGAAHSSFVAREVVESIAVAIVLALLFRAFEAEAFVIPTGSMAPTLMGEHHDIECSACGYLFPTGYSGDREQVSAIEFYGAVCPLCGFTKRIDPEDSNHRPFTGDRILVNKFAYQFWEPERWDVIVFKNPGNPKQNYIKRLVGLPNETIRIHCGDIYIRSKDADAFQIARKPPEKIRRLLRLVHDTQHIPQALLKAQWPAWRPAQDAASANWKISEDQTTYTLDATEQTAWLHYVHTTPLPGDWQRDQLHTRAVPQPRLITDLSGYNTGFYISRGANPRTFGHDFSFKQADGYHWTPDLAVDCHAEAGADGGVLTVQLVEAGEPYTCEIDLRTGTATLTVPTNTPFTGKGGTTLTAKTEVEGSGSHALSLANVDDRLLLWVDGKLVTFQDASGSEHDGSYQGVAGARPQWSEQDPGDLHPVRIGAKGAAVTLSGLRVYRDMYYLAVDGGGMLDYRGFGGGDAEAVFKNPQTWSTTELFPSRRYVEFTMGEDQFFPLGDNSAVSQDARMWHGIKQVDYPHKNTQLKIDPWVERDRLIGKAFFVYWPHAWRLGDLPIIPNVRRIGTIR